jgi:elongation factor P
MKIIANDIRAGNVLEYRGKLYVVARQPDHIKPGKGGAYVQVEMKEIQTGTKLNERLHSDDTIEKVSLDSQEHQYLYPEGDHICLMNLSDFDQVNVNKSLLGEKIAYLKEDMKIVLESYNEKPIRVILPETVVLRISETEPVVKGQTAASSYKPAVLENGVRIMVPPFVDAGTLVIVKTEDDSYVERYKG